MAAVPCAPGSGVSSKVPGPLRSGAGTTVVHTADGDREVQYADVDGLAVFEGDIVLGTVEEVAAQAGPEGIGITGGIITGQTTVDSAVKQTEAEFGTLYGQQ